MNQDAPQGFRRQGREHASDELLRIDGADGVRFDLVVEEVEQRTEVDELPVAARDVGDVRCQLRHRHFRREVALEDVRGAVLLQHLLDGLVVVVRVLPATDAGVYVVLLHQPVNALVVHPVAVAQDLRGEFRPRLQQTVVDLARQAFKPIGRGDVPVVLDVAHEPDEFRVAFGLRRGLAGTVVGAARDPGDAAGILDRSTGVYQRPDRGYLFFFAKSSDEDSPACFISAV